MFVSKKRSETAHKAVRLASKVNSANFQRTSSEVRFAPYFNIK